MGVEREELLRNPQKSYALEAKLETTDQELQERVQFWRGSFGTEVERAR